MTLKLPKIYPIGACFTGLQTLYFCNIQANVQDMISGCKERFYLEAQVCVQCRAVSQKRILDCQPSIRRNIEYNLAKHNRL